MADEINEEVVKDEPKVEEKKLSDIEIKAQHMGWRGKEHWTGSEEEFIDAAEFVRRKPLFDKIESQKNFYDRKIKDVETTLNQLAQHHAKVKETEYQRALTDLRHAKRAAIQEGDAVAALDITDRMESLQEEREQEIQQLEKEKAQVVQQPQVSQEFLTWIKSNDWYTKDADMNAFADGAAAAFIQRSKQAGERVTEQEVFSHVTEKVKRAYPEKFENPNRDRPGTVSSGDRGGNKSIKAPKSLPEEYEAIARNFEKNGVMKREEYIKQLSDMGVI